MSGESASDRRRFKRDPFSRVAWLTVITAEGHVSACWECRTFDLSRGGLGLRSLKEVIVGPQVVVEIMDGKGGRQKVLHGVVRQCREIDHGDYLIGIEFSHAEVSPDLQTHLDRWESRAA